MRACSGFRVIRIEFTHGSPRAHHRHHRTGRVLPGGAAAREGLRGLRPGPAAQRAERLAHRAPARSDHAASRATCSTSSRSSGSSSEARPDEVYNLAAMSFVPTSWDQPMLTGEFNAPGRHARARGHPPGGPEDPLLPGLLQRDVRQGPGGAADARRRRSTRAARTASPRSTATTSRSTTARATACSPCSGILFNHESPAPRAGVRDPQGHRRRRADQARADQGAARWATSTPSATGALPATTCEAMWLMLQQDGPDDYVIATGADHSVRESGGDGVRATPASTGRKYVRVDPAFLRPAEVDHLLGESGKGPRRSSAGSRA